MNVSRRDLAVAGAFALGASGLLLSGFAGAEAADEAAVTQSVETLRTRTSASCSTPRSPAIRSGGR